MTQYEYAKRRAKEEAVASAYATAMACEAFARGDMEACLEETWRAVCHQASSQMFEVAADMVPAEPEGEL